MDKPELHLHLLIDKLAQSSISFALFRLPWTDEPILVLQKDGEVEKLNTLNCLNGKRGFLFAPFQPSSIHPVLLIRPDLYVTGWNEIMQQLSELYADADCIEDTPTTVNHTEKKSIQSESQLKALYNEAFQNFIAPLREETFEKLVLSRSATYPLKEDFSPVDAFVTASNNYPRMMISLCHIPDCGTWIGSTPEIILSGQHPSWQTVALAGTMQIEDEYIPTQWSPKNQKEQRIVSDYIYKILKSFKSKVEQKGPYTARAGHLVHLKTDFLFSLKNADHLGDLLEALHPTPAVCGLPKEEAYQFILNHERHDRSYYSGIVGWLDPEFITNLYVNLRCMHIANGQATLYAGGGILHSSTAESEWEETQIKMNTMRKCLC